MLTDHGLAAALEDLTADAALPVELELDEARLRADVEAAAYFLVAEALANVAKHAQATAVAATVERRGDELVITVADDGRGGADPLRGSGLHGLADRVAALGGTLALDSPPGRHDAARLAPAMRPEHREHREHAPVVGRSWPSSSFSKMLVTCFSTAGGLTCRRSAIPRLDSPRRSAPARRARAASGRRAGSRGAGGRASARPPRDRARCRRRRPCGPRRGSRRDPRSGA